MSAREVARKLGIDVVDIADFSCCGFPVKSSNAMSSLVIAARNLAIASKNDKDICTLCNACTSVLTEANKQLTEDKKLRDEVNKELKNFGLEFTSGVAIKHFSRLLYEDIGIDFIKDHLIKDLSMLRMSIHYGCHYLRPSELYDNFDNCEHPVSVDKLVEVTGAAVINYKNKLDCCGGAILGVEEDIALSMAKEKLDHITNNNVDALITICPFCSIMYEDNQRKIESKFDVQYHLPVLYYPQILGLAMGIEPKPLGFRLNKIKAKQLLEKAGVNK
jgi:heterodisulfide reductase subunit B